MSENSSPDAVKTWPYFPAVWNFYLSPGIWLMSNRGALLLFVALTVTMLGCGGAKSVTGGTKGILKLGGESLGEIQLTVHQVDGGGTKAVGFAVTASDGSFELLRPGASGALWLAPGEYRFTVESIGAPIQFPVEFTRPESTSLKVVWSANDRNLNLEGPAPVSAR